MSPPIRDGSGSSIGSIRLGDGSEISEVRTGAGDVLFSATTIPDSDLYYGFRSGDTSSVEDRQGTNNGSYTGNPQLIAANGFDSGLFLNLDTNDHVIVPRSVLTNPTSSSWSVGIRVNITQTDTSQRTFWEWSDGSKVVKVVRNNGSIGMQVFDGNNTVAKIGGSEPSLPYVATVLATYDNSANDYAVFINDVEVRSSISLNLTQQDAFKIGESTNGNFPLEDGVDAFAVWDNQTVTPSEYDPPSS